MGQCFSDHHLQPTGVPIKNLQKVFKKSKFALFNSQYRDLQPQYKKCQGGQQSKKIKQLKNTTVCFRVGNQESEGVLSPPLLPGPSTSLPILLILLPSQLPISIWSISSCTPRLYPAQQSPRTLQKYTTINTALFFQPSKHSSSPTTCQSLKTFQDGQQAFRKSNLIIQKAAFVAAITNWPLDIGMV